MTFNSVKLNGIKDRIFFALDRIPILIIYLDDINELHKLMDMKIVKYELKKMQEINKLSLTDEEYVNEYIETFKKYGL